MSYAELHCHSYFSLLDGASSPESLVERVSELHMPALALTDHDAVYGAVRFSKAAKSAGIHPVFGAELTLDSGHLTLLVKDARGWSNLCWLITQARHNAPKGEACFPEHLLENHTDGLIALSGCRHGAISQAILRGDKRSALDTALHYCDWFGADNFYMELQCHLLSEDGKRNAHLIALAEHLDLPIVATNNVHYAHGDGHRLQDVLIGIRHNAALDECSHLRLNSEYFLKSADEMRSLFADLPHALENTLEIADRCAFDLHHGLQSLPIFPTPDELSADAYLLQLCERGLTHRGLEASEVHHQLAHELHIIARSGLSSYFLIVWDIVRFSREHGIRCQGRGSAANSLVAYLLNISPVNPLAHDLVFERFLSDERQVVPDIDIDFDAARREEVIQYIYSRWGHEHAAMACTFVTFRARSALRDVGKTLGLPPEIIDHAAKTVDVYRAGSVQESAGLQDFLHQRITPQTWADWLDLCEQLDGLPRHLGIHNGGMVITGDPMTSRIPVEPATMEDRYVVQWDKEGLEDAGLVKIDILGLRMLSALSDTVKIVHLATSEYINLDALTFDDPAVYEMITSADTVGMFQVESRAQAQVQPRLRPTCFNDLIVSISLIRPGPVQGDMVHPYLRRRSGQEEISYFHPKLEPALKETLGVILFQEQVLKVARDLAGFSAGQGELLRRALGAKDADLAIAEFRGDFVAGAMQNGVDQDTAEEVFSKLQAFGGYSFPKSHAAAFAVLVYQSAWLKRYYPEAFFTALLNNQPMGFWSPAVLVNDAKRHNISVLPVHIQQSDYLCTLEGDAILLGINYVHGFGEETAKLLLDARNKKSFKDVDDLCRRTRLPLRLVENLIQSGALDEWGKSRRELLWRLGNIHYQPLSLADDDEIIDLPQLSRAETTVMEMGMTGVTVGEHPLTFYRETLRKRRIASSLDLERLTDGIQVTTTGLLVVHQAPHTAKGFRFLTLEDEFGFINVIVRPSVYSEFRQVVRAGGILTVRGKLQREGAVTNVIANLVHPFQNESL
ncbi:MAG: DNA polymerase III subunit alpha [Aggregatilineales bacterium]